MTKDAHMKPGPKPTVGLTQAQRDTMRVIRQYQQQNGMSPTVSKALVLLKSSSNWNLRAIANAVKAKLGLLN